MNCLILDTTCDDLFVGLLKNNDYNYIKNTNNRKLHNVVLLDSIEKLLNNNNITLKDINYFCVVQGPGSFTGIRLGLATTNAFAFSHNKQICQISSFRPYLGKSKNLFIECNKDTVYYAKSENLNNISIINKDEMNTIKDSFYISSIDPILIKNAFIEEINKNNLTDKAEAIYIHGFFK